jgi:O-antigen/teichoic acid export membrane protein
MLHRLANKILPNRIHDRLIGAWDIEGFNKYFRNTGWMFVGKMMAFVTSFFTIAIVARYLGPENLGKISYAQSLIAIFSMFASLGIDHIVYRDLVAHPEREGEILGTAIATKLVFGGLTFIVTLATALSLHDDPILTWIVGIIALSFIIQPLSTIGHVFGARVLAKYPAIVSIVFAFLMPALKLTVIWFDKGILYFAGLITLEALLLSLIYILLYKKILAGSFQSFTVSWNTFKNMVHDSWPLMLVGVTGYLYARIDQVMIQHFIDSTSVGLYEAAVRLTEPLGFFPGVIIGSLFPALINARKDSPEEYRKRFRSLVGLCMGISTFLALTIYILAPYLIGWLYGDAYTASVSILRIYVWSNVGTVATLLMYNYFIAENKTRLQLIYTTIGALLNITLNALLIPVLGITGAAYATLITVIVVVGTFLCTKRWLT